MKKPESPQPPDDDLEKLAKFRKTSDDFREAKLKAATMLEAAKLLPDEASGKQERIDELLLAIERWGNSIKIIQEDHIAPLVEKLAPMHETYLELGLRINSLETRKNELEFAIEQVADKESIFVSDSDIESAIKAAKTPEERESLTKERYYLASILRRQKTLDFLAAL